MLKDTVFCHSQENLMINMKMDTATKTGIDAVKTVSKQVVQKTAEATGDSIGNKIADDITLLGKTKSKKNKTKRNNRNLNTTREKTGNY